jgi:hypothetical protein
MRKPVFVLALGLLLGISVLTARGQDPRTPSYLILRAPAQVPHGPSYYPGRGYAVKPQAYAYGWFGAQPRSHWRRQTGHFSAYIQWSKQ